MARVRSQAVRRWTAAAKEALESAPHSLATVGRLWQELTKNVVAPYSAVVDKAKFFGLLGVHDDPSLVEAVALEEIVEAGCEQLKLVVMEALTEVLGGGRG